MIVIYQLIKKHDTNNIILASAGMAFAFFMLPTQIHERYLFPFFALFVLIALNNKKYLWMYIILTITYLLNLMMILPFYRSGIFHLIQIFLNISHNLFSFTRVAIVIAVVNVLTFIYFNKIGIFNNLLHNLKNDFLRLKKYIKSLSS